MHRYDEVKAEYCVLKKVLSITLINKEKRMIDTVNHLWLNGKKGK